MPEFYRLPSGFVFDFADIMEMYFIPATEFDKAKIIMQSKSRPPVVARDAKGRSTLMPLMKEIREDDEDFQTFRSWMLTRSTWDI